MQLELRHRLLFVEATVIYQGKTVSVDNIVVDTGSGATILSADILERIGIIPSPEDGLHVIRGVGGRELVYTRKIDYLQVGERKLKNFEIEVGGLDYGYEINGILGLDFLIQSHAIVDLNSLRLEFA